MATWQVEKVLRSVGRVVKNGIEYAKKDNKLYVKKWKMDGQLTLEKAYDPNHIFPFLPKAPEYWKKLPMSQKEAKKKLERKEFEPGLKRERFGLFADITVIYLKSETYRRNLKDTEAVFQVPCTTTKPELKEYLEKVYNCKVARINMSIQDGMRKQVEKKIKPGDKAPVIIRYREPDRKRAFVTFEEKWERDEPLDSSEDAEYSLPPSRQVKLSTGATKYHNQDIITRNLRREAAERPPRDPVDDYVLEYPKNAPLRKY